MKDKYLDQINIRLSQDLSDFIDDFSRKAKRNYGKKIPKEKLVQAVLFFFKDSIEKAKSNARIATADDVYDFLVKHSKLF